MGTSPEALEKGYAHAGDVGRRCREGFMEGNRAIIKVILVEGWGDDWAAYAGPGNWSDDRIAQNGNRLQRESAMEVAASGGQAKWPKKPYRV